MPRLRISLPLLPSNVRIDGAGRSIARLSPVTVGHCQWELTSWLPGGDHRCPNAVDFKGAGCGLRNYDRVLNL